MTASERKEIVNEVLDTIQANAIDAEMSFSIDSEGYLCVSTESV